MRKYDYDLFTIGAGSGGVAASRRAGSYGARVGLCEELRVGGTCVLRGCVPKKLLVYASHVRRDLEDAAGYGWSIKDATIDWGHLIAAKNAELDRLVGIYNRMLDNANVDVHMGRGVVVDPHTVEVAGKRFTAERILVAVGGWPVRIDIPGAEHAITSNEALELPVVPRRVAVIGGGYIGVEFAGIFTGAGSEVTQIIRADRVLRGFDDDIRVALGEELTKRGIKILNKTTVESITKHGDGLSLALSDGSSLDVDVVMMAIGRQPKTAGLGLEQVGVTLDEGGFIVVDQWSRTSAPGIWAIGDNTNRPALTPVAIADGRAFAQTEFSGNPVPVDHQSIPTAVFSQPQVGTVGLPEHVARQQADVEIYRTRFRPMKDVLPGRDSQTMMKLVVDRASRRVLGVHMVGDDAAEIVQGFAVALRCGATKEQFDATVGVHPSSAEEFVTMATPVKDD